MAGPNPHLLIGCVIAGQRPGLNGGVPHSRENQPADVENGNGTGGRGAEGLHSLRQGPSGGDQPDAVVGSRVDDHSPGLHVLRRILDRGATSARRNECAVIDDSGDVVGDICSGKRETDSHQFRSRRRTRDYHEFHRVGGVHHDVVVGCHCGRADLGGDGVDDLDISAGARETERDVFGVERVETDAGGDRQSLHLRGRQHKDVVGPATDRCAVSDLSEHCVVDDCDVDTGTDTKLGVAGVPAGVRTEVDFVCCCDSHNSGSGQNGGAAESCRGVGGRLVEIDGTGDRHSRVLRLVVDLAGGSGTRRNQSDLAQSIDGYVGDVRYRDIACRCRCRQDDLVLGERSGERNRHTRRTAAAARVGVLVLVLAAV